MKKLLPILLALLICNSAYAEVKVKKWPTDTPVLVAQLSDIPPDPDLSAYAKLTDPAQTLKALKFGILEGGSSPTKYTYFQGGNQTADLTYTLPTAYPSATKALTSTNAGVMDWATIPAQYWTLSGSTISPNYVVDMVGKNLMASTIYGGWVNTGYTGFVSAVSPDYISISIINVGINPVQGLSYRIRVLDGANAGMYFNIIANGTNASWDAGNDWYTLDNDGAQTMNFAEFDSFEVEVSELSINGIITIGGFLSNNFTGIVGVEGDSGHYNGYTAPSVNITGGIGGSGFTGAGGGEGANGGQGANLALAGGAGGAGTGEFGVQGANGAILLNSKVYVGGTTTPTARLHIAAGSSTAQTAPIKFTSGALTSSAVAGQVEYLSGKFYIRGTEGWAFSGSTEYINSANSGHLDINANTSIDLNKDTIITGDCKATTFHVGTDAGIDATVTYVDTLLGAKTLTFKKGILTSQT